jgi:AcrR family transcriptional regulator
MKIRETSVSIIAVPTTSVLAEIALNPSDALTDAPGDEVSERILDAALEQFELLGIRRSTIDDIARRAKVGRVTIFRRFDSKDGLVRALVQREARQLMIDADDSMATIEPIEERTVEGFVVAFRAAQNHPLMRGLMATEPEMLLPLLTTEGGPALAIATAFLLPHVREAHKHHRAPGDPAVAAELAGRIGISLLLTPSGVMSLSDDDQARAFARTYLVPIVTGR